jgi:hypothetical protein
MKGPAFQSTRPADSLIFSTASTLSPRFRALVDEIWRERHFPGDQLLGSAYGNNDRQQFLARVA